MRHVCCALALVLGLLGLSTNGLAQTPSASAPRNAQGVMFNHVSLEVPNFENEVAFWVALGGTRRAPAAQAPATPAGAPAPTRFALIEFPDINITVREGMGRGGTVGSAVNHIGFQVKNTPEAMARFAAAGLKTEPGGFPGQGWLVSPAEARVEILQDPNLAVPIRGHHIHFNTADVTGMQAWYAKTFGAIPGKRGNFDAADITASNTVMNLTFTKADAPQAPTKGRAVDHIAFSVTGLRQFVEQLRAQDVVVDQPFALQPNGRTGLAFIVDPWGTRIELIDENAGAGR